MNDSLNLRYFKIHEFERASVNWFHLMSPELLCRLDALRGVWGSPIHLSKHPKAIGREDATSSQHNYKKWGEVRAVDVFPSGGYQRSFYDLVEQIGFTGIGYYPNWKQGDLKGGFHLDVRADAFQWGWTDKMITIEEALNVSAD